MTRRKFIRKSIEAVCAIVAGAGWLAKKAVPRRFVRAIGLGKFTGSLRSLSNINTQSKWSG
jgi:hypothetical protein